MNLTLGEIRLMGSPRIEVFPYGFLPCLQFTHSTQAYPALAGLLGQRYGGDGVDTFGLPQIVPAAPTNGLALPWAICWDGTAPSAGLNGYLGEIRALPVPPIDGSALAKSWLPCDGRLLSIVDYSPLFSLIGIAFGGDGIHNFALPALTLPMVQGAPLPLYICARQGTYPTCSTANPADLYIGEIRQLAFPLDQRLCNVLKCNGQSVVANSIYQQLGEVLGFYDVGSTFAVPALPKATAPLTQAIAFLGNFPFPDPPP